MAPRNQSALGSVLVVAGASVGLLREAFVGSGAARRVSPHASPMAAATVRAAPARGTSAASAIAGAAVGMVGTAAVAASAARRSRVATRVAAKDPSLLQLLEQKKFLSLTESLGVLSTAERAGLGLRFVERLGLLKFAEERGLLSFAESVLCSPSTPIKLLGAAAALAFAVFSEFSLELPEEVQWLLAGLLGLPALILGVAGLAILLIFGGARQTKTLDIEEKVVVYDPRGGFKTQRTRKAVTLLNVLEEKGLLSFAQDLGLLGLADSLVSNPLTLTEELRVLSTLERAGLLTDIESTASDPGAPSGAGLIGLFILVTAFFIACLVPGYGIPVAVLLTLPGLVLLGVGLGLALIQAPVRG